MASRETVRIVLAVFILLISLYIIYKFISAANYYGRLSVKAKYIMAAPAAGLIDSYSKISNDVKKAGILASVGTAAGIAVMTGCMYSKFSGNSFCKKIFRNIVEKRAKEAGINPKFITEFKIERGEIRYKMLEITQSGVSEGNWRNLGKLVSSKSEFVKKVVTNRYSKYAVLGGSAVGLGYFSKDYTRSIFNFLSDIVEGILSSISPEVDAAGFDENGEPVTSNFCKDIKNHLLPQAYALLETKYGKCDTDDENWVSLYFQYIVAKRAIYTFSESLYGLGGSGAGYPVIHYIITLGGLQIGESKGFNIKDIGEKDILCWWAGMKSKRSDEVSVLEEIYGKLDSPSAKEYIKDDRGGDICNDFGINIDNVITKDEDEGIDIIDISGIVSKIKITNTDMNVRENENYEGYIPLSTVDDIEIDFINLGAGGVTITFTGIKAI